MKNLKKVSHEPLSKHTYFELGGPADLFTVVRSAAELEQAVIWAEKKTLPWFILGGGSNILVGDLGFRGLVIKNEARGLKRQGTVITAESGVLISQLVKQANEHGLGGLAVFMSLPGTVGGAIYNNAHFRPEKNEFIGNLVKSAEMLTTKPRNHSSTEQPLRIRKRVNRDWFEFGYDYSRLQQEKTALLTVDFQLQKTDPEVVKKQSIETIKRRNQHQPIGHACSGCVFKNPEGDSAGRLIDEAGLKGLRVGGAYVSQKHANFIINDGTATVRNVLELMVKVVRKVQQLLKVQLEPEIFLVGQFSWLPKELDGQIHH